MTKNPYFGSAEHPYTMLFRLLPDISEGRHPNGRIGILGKADTLRAVLQHTENVQQSLNTFQQSLGRILALACQHEDMDAATMEDMGWLLRHLGNLQEACHALEGEARFELTCRGEKA